MVPPSSVANYDSNDMKQANILRQLGVVGTKSNMGVLYYIRG